jgi:predicted aconitase with swiveling domain
MSEPLSLWGGFDLGSGRVADVNHPQHQQVISGRILAMPGGRGSSSSSSILLESARLGIHPRAVVLVEPDPILVIGALVAEDLYGVTIPVILVPQTVLENLRPGAQVIVSSGGEETGLCLEADPE